MEKGSVPLLAAACLVILVSASPAGARQIPADAPDEAQASVRGQALAGLHPPPADAGTLTLAAAIVEALERSPELASRTDTVRLAEVGARLARSEFSLKFTPTFSAGTDPAIGATRNAGLAVTKRIATGAEISANLSSYQYGTDAARLRDTGYTIGISQPLLRGFQRTATAGLTASARAVESAARERETARANLAVRVTRQFLEIVKQQRLEAAAEKAAERATRLRVASEARVQVGLGTELDVLRARILASQSAAAAATAAAAVASAADELAVLIGRPLDGPMTVDAADLTLLDRFAPLAASGDELVRAALASQPAASAPATAPGHPSK